jgi:aryl-alcohol dehydrogenase-like predicted oxidoreductase
MLERAIEDDLWDVVMVGFNFLNPSARTLLARAKERGIGTLDMFAVRRALQSVQNYRSALRRMIENGVVDTGAIDRDDPVEAALRDGMCSSITEMAYRFCAHEPNIDVVLCGTGSIDHVEENVRSIQRPPLPEGLASRLEELFGRVDSVSGNEGPV